MRIISIDAYDGIRQVFKDYWTAYGGWRALFHSGYFHLAIILTVCLSPRWLSVDWPDDVIDVIPSVLGFSLGGYAMLLAFGDRSFLRMLSEPVEPNKASYFVELNASFVHFIILQTITIFLALIGKAYVSSSASPLQLAFAALSYMLFLILDSFI